MFNMLFCDTQQEKINMLQKKFNKEGFYFNEIKIICESCCNNCDNIECEARIGYKNKKFFKVNAY